MLGRTQLQIGGNLKGTKRETQADRELHSSQGLGRSGQCGNTEAGALVAVERFIPGLRGMDPLEMPRERRTVDKHGSEVFELVRWGFGEFVEVGIEEPTMFLTPADVEPDTISASTIASPAWMEGGDTG